MQDRQPGAPGQYILKISVEEVQKLLNSEDCVVVLTRDDQPVVEGTPLNKATFLPDELAAKICPDIEDPTPADALQNVFNKAKDAVIMTTATATLSASGWVNNSQTVNVTGVTVDNSIIPCPAPTSHTAYHESGVRCSAQANGKLTFTCDRVPSVNLTVNVLILT